MKQEAKQDDCVMHDRDATVPYRLERWIPASMAGHEMERVRAAITIMVLAVNILFCFISVLFIEFFLVHTVGERILYARVVIYPCFFLYLFAAYCLFVLQSYHAARLLVILNVFLACFVGVMLTGGYSASPVSSLVVLPVLFSFVLLGVRWGIISAVLILAILVPACVMEIYGLYTPLQLIPDKKSFLGIALFVPIVGTAMVVFSLIFYETLTKRLQVALESERNKFHWDATHDALTGLPNRPEFYHRLQLAMRNAEVNEQDLALVFFDLDGFKPVNDTLGHHAGDIVLQAVGDRLESIIRGVDTVARLGGDEFAIILQGVSVEPFIFDTILQKILKTVAEPITIDGKSVSVGASLGVTLYRSGCSLDNLCKQADVAMYAAKKTKNTWQLYSESLVDHSA